MDRPHSQELSTNSSTLVTNSRTAPKRCASQPVNGTEIALATPKLVITQVPCAGLTPMSPAIVGIETLAIDESSTFMNVASANATVPSSLVAPVSGGSGAANGLLAPLTALARAAAPCSRG